MAITIDKSMIETKPRYLTAEDIKALPQGQRCVICLERAYAIWIETSEPAGCPFGHLRKENCKEHAVPAARNRGDMVELRNRGLLKPPSVTRPKEQK